MSSVSGPGGAGRNGRARSSIPAAAVGEGSAAGGKSADDGKDSREGDSEKEIVDHVRCRCMFCLLTCFLEQKKQALLPFVVFERVIIWMVGSWLYA